MQLENKWFLAWNVANCLLWEDKTLFDWSYKTNLTGNHEVVQDQGLSFHDTKPRLSCELKQETVVIGQ